MGKTIVKILLMITLVIQPVLLSYAMASGGHHHMGQAMEAHHHGMTEMHDQADHAAHDEDQTSFFDNCCTTPACAAAAFSEITAVALEYCSLTYRPNTLSFIGVTLPSDRKPPRF